MTFACEWIKQHWDDRGGHLESLMTQDEELIQCVMDGDVENELAAYYIRICDLSHAPCEWIKKHWYDVNPPDYPCEWVRQHWNEN